MQNVLPLTFETIDRFAGLQPEALNEAEQASVVRLALAVLEARHRPGAVFEKPEASCEYLRLLLSERRNEVFGTMFLDNRHRLLGIEELFQGDLDGVSVPPRIVVQHALDLNAAAVIFFHNHPSGVPEPSESDKRITRRLREALALVHVRVLDHIVVGAEGTVSMAEHGLI